MGISYSDLLTYLQTNCNGKQNICYAERILIDLTGSSSENQKRLLREQIRNLRERGFPIVIPRDSQGYFWAIEPSDLSDFLGLMRLKAFSSLKLVAKMLRLSMPDLQGQLRLKEIDSEPTVPTVCDGGDSGDFKPVVSCYVDIPTDLYSEFSRFIESNREWDFSGAITNALAMFLLQNGSRSRVASQAYLAHLSKE